MHPYRVPKRRVPVRISVASQPEREALIFVGERAESHSGPERPSDVMNGDDGFFAIEAEGGTVEFLRRGVVAFVRAPAQIETEEIQAEDESTFQLTLLLDDGRRLDGRVRYLLPASARRVLDFLNLPDRFLRLERTEDVLLVNKQRIVSARMVEGTEDLNGSD